MIRLFRYYFMYFKKEFIIAPLFKLIESCFELAIPFLVSIIIDKGIKLQNWEIVWKYSLIIFSLGVAGFLFALLAQYYATKASVAIGTMIRNKVYFKVSRLPYRSLGDTSSFLTIVTNDSYRIQDAVAMTLRLILRSPVLIIGATIMAFLTNYKFSLIFIVISPILAFIVWSITKYTSPKYASIQSKLDTLGARTSESILGSKVIQSFSIQKKFQEKFASENIALSEESNATERIAMLLNPLTLLTINLAVVVILWLGSLEMTRAGIGAGTLTSFVNYLFQILMAMIMFANFISLINKSAASAKRINTLLMKPEFRYGSTDFFDEETDISISFKNVSYMFSETSSKILSDINLEIKKGEKIGIVGSTGSGKSILSYLLGRLYIPTEGTVLLYGKDLYNIEKQTYDTTISFVPQNATLFKRTIRENLVLGTKEKVSNEDIIKALDAACATSFCKEKNGFLDYNIVEGGSNFSGGQKQRLAIARGLIAKSKILVLDDSFSALDNITSQKVRKNIFKLNKYDNVIIISQKIRDVCDLDKIIVLDKGSVCAFDNHNNLIKTCSVYKEFCKSQQILGGRS